ncbi:C-GCAxxG-C-C family protein [Thermodesulfobacteriota bacterium]
MAVSASEEKILINLDQKVDAYLKVSGNCAQSSFLALKEEFGLEDGSILKALTPFPGLAYRGGVCGTLIGCTMALGIVFGRENIDDWDGYIHAIPPVRAFFRRFQKKVGSIMCSEVVESEFGEKFESIEPAETKRWLEAGAIERCTDVARKGVRIAAQIIFEKKA